MGGVLINNRWDQWVWSMSLENPVEYTATLDIGTQDEAHSPRSFQFHSLGKKWDFLL